MTKKRQLILAFSRLLSTFYASCPQLNSSLLRIIRFAAAHGFFRFHQGICAISGCSSLTACTVHRSSMVKAGGRNKKAVLSVSASPGPVYLFCADILCNFAARIITDDSNIYIGNFRRPGRYRNHCYFNHCFITFWR